jgi:2-polyprenyl-3-methyl-5-hydroxy-6-metoxy-1,4-benzoquinol methylase
MNLMLCPICGCERGKDFLRAPDRFHQRKTTYRLVRCPSCSLVWLHNPPKSEEMPYHYGADYHKTITNAGETHIDNRWRYPCKRVLEMAQSGALLDIGCGSGGLLQTLRGADWKLYGVEISPEEARRAEASSGAQVFVGEILDAPFSESSFDVITGFHVLEHVSRPNDVIAKLWNWLKPGGILYLHVPNVEALEARIFRSYWYGLELPRHLYHFSPSSLSRLFAHFHFDELLLGTLSHNHIEASMHYVLDSIRQKFGITYPPLAAVDPSPGMAWRIVRKLLRVSMLEPVSYLAAVVGRGAGIEAAYRKRAS